MVTRDDVLGALREVIDPELGLNIVDLGLVYRVEIENGRVHVTMTATSAACPLSGYLASAAETAVRQRVPEAEAVEVEMVWDPPWHPGMVSEAARRQLW
jgi:metal-sulfur cluster biosynthetic enzyme